MAILLIDKQAAPGVCLLTLNRPEVRNALNTELLGEITEALDGFSKDDEIRAAVITGNTKVFAAGADIRELAAMDVLGVLEDRRPHLWQRIYRFPKPLIAAVNGYALGAGCELAMHADIVIAGSNARFGQPEINLGTIPGAGGTQRLVRAVGKSLAMRMVLSGEPIDAATAVASGLAAEISDPEQTVNQALALASTLAARAPVAIRLAKEMVLKSFESSLSDGLGLERKAFAILAATEDRREGIAAFLEKRKANFQGR